MQTKESSLRERLASTKKTYGLLVTDIIFFSSEMENTAVPTGSVSRSYSSLTQEERRNMLIAQLLARYPAPEHDRAFPRNPNMPITRDDSITSQLEETPEDRIGNTHWCLCESCIPMATQIESVCCREISEVHGCIPEGSKCITNADMFISQIATEEHVRLMFMTMHLDDLPVVDANNNRRLRKTAYRAFIAWIYGFLGKGNRRVIPSCAIKVVREVFPDPNGSYVGFLYSDDYDASEMAFH
ncbi:P2X purinoceptor 7-like [Aquarana catesbeiana]|uniref:P2X purinoceptor 7-like n=1 Tax=Aquarana catesbeiana TaxID=8400 RepID=UPI003CC96549